MTETIKMQFGTFGAVLATAALVVAMALPVGATKNEGGNGGECNGRDNCDTETTNTDNSTNVNGNYCVVKNVDQKVDQDTDQTNRANTLATDTSLVEVHTDGDVSASTNQSQHSEQTGSNTITQDCSTSNVTNNHHSTTVQHAAAGRGGAVLGVQVAAPVGGVGAGAGGAVAASGLSAFLGLGTSLGALGAGLRLRKFQQ